MYTTPKLEGLSTNREPATSANAKDPPPAANDSHAALKGNPGQSVKLKSVQFPSLVRSLLSDCSRQGRQAPFQHVIAAGITPTKPTKPPKPKFATPRPKPDVPATLPRMHVCPDVSPMDFVNHMDIYPERAPSSITYTNAAAARLRDTQASVPVPPSASSQTPNPTPELPIQPVEDQERPTCTSALDEQEFLEVLQLNIVAITKFMNEFNMSVRSRLGSLNSKLAKLERNMDYYDKMKVKMHVNRK